MKLPFSKLMIAAAISIYAVGLPALAETAPGQEPSSVASGLGEIFMPTTTDLSRALIERDNAMLEYHARLAEAAAARTTAVEAEAAAAEPADALTTAEALRDAAKLVDEGTEADMSAVIAEVTAKLETAETLARPLIEAREDATSAATSLEARHDEAEAAYEAANTAFLALIATPEMETVVIFTPTDSIIRPMPRPAGFRSTTD